MAGVSWAQIKRFPLVEGSWVAIIAPLDCNYLLIVGNADGSPMDRCSDPDDPLAWYTMPSGGWFGLSAPPGPQSPWVVTPGLTPSNGFRFHAGDTVTYLRAQTGVGPAVVEFYI
jgi:hypothetical protein